jgi:hypothetical protein
LTHSVGRRSEKGFVCNATNYDVIADAYGDETDDWTGQPIELFPTKVAFKGQLTDAIRVRIPQAKPASKPAPTPKPAPAPVELDDEIQF